MENTNVAPRPSKNVDRAFDSEYPDCQLNIKALLPMAADGVGPSATCTHLLQGMAKAGANASLYVNRSNIEPSHVALTSAVPRIFSRLPYKLIHPFASDRIEKKFTESLEAGDVAYLWPSVSLKTHETLAERGFFLVLEGINTRMANAKKILDDEYRRLGLTPSHGITEERIEEEEKKLALASAFFAPSAGVEDALTGSPIPPQVVIPSSYGVDLSLHTVRQPLDRDRPLKYLFVGYACVRKGIHHLLRAWERAGGFGELMIGGAIEPAIRELCADQLNRDDVTTLGFVRDVKSLYDDADIFVLPSLEEGDPLVTYEAAAHGLPLVVSPMGAGRIAENGHGAITVDPTSIDSLTSALQAVTQTDTRRQLGRDARQTVEGYDWNTVGKQRLRDLNALIRGMP